MKIQLSQDDQSVTLWTEGGIVLAKGDLDLVHRLQPISIGDEMISIADGENYLLALLQKFNPNRGPDGRFAPSAASIANWRTGRSWQATGIRPPPLMASPEVAAKLKPGGENLVHDIKEEKYQARLRQFAKPVNASPGQVTNVAGDTGHLKDAHQSLRQHARPNNQYTDHEKQNIIWNYGKVRENGNQHLPEHSDPEHASQALESLKHSMPNVADHTLAVVTGHVKRLAHIANAAAVRGDRG